MGQSKMRVRYIDNREIFIPKLTYYPGGVTLPHGDNIISVTEGERKNLFRIKNGTNECWEDVRERRPREEKED